MYKHFLYLLIILTLFGCSKSDTNLKTSTISDLHNQELFVSARSILKENSYYPDELIKHVNNLDNIYTYQKSIGEFKYYLKFTPLDYIILKEFGDSVSKKDFIERKNEISDFDYFTFVISIQNFKDEPLRFNLTNQEDYYKRLSYLANEIGKDLKYFNGVDTVDCSIFHFERTFGVSQYLTVNLAFEKSNGKMDRVLFFEDHLFNNGRLIFTMPKEIFVYQPKLIIE